ncbi:ubiquitin-like domain-containing protein [Virgibacillus senegalensis]|uniref:ubiquitin-like domain-containing protein n=1 Tax=Virgibacillus senegalensis TaxID=1499679 RepID=UPI00069D461B|nr:G5 and 3D domain-containing protein [Virgibacillus senegalensis]
MKLFSKLLSAFRTKPVIYAASITVVLFLAGILTFQVTKAQVSVKVDGETTTVRTHADTVGGVLEELNIEVGEHDKLSHDLAEKLTSGMNIDYTKAVEVVITTDGDNQTYYTTSETVGDVLEENNIDIDEHDQVAPALSKAVSEGLQVTIDKAFQVTVDDAGEKEKYWTVGETVEDLLKREDIKLGKLDRINLEMDEPVSKDAAIEITRVEKVTDIVKEKTDYSVVTRKDDNLEKGKEKVVSSGEEGLVAKHFEVTLENGKEVDRQLVKEEVEKESEQRIVAVGTKVEKPAPKPAVTATAANTSTETVSRGGDGDSSDAKTYYMHATAYSANCSGCSGITATGINLKDNPNAKVIAVDPNVIPLGSKVWVEGYGNAIAGDTGGNVSGNKIDVHVSSTSEAHRFGSKKVKVKVLD